MPTEQKARLDIRLDPDRKKLIEEAASLLGETVTAFTVSSAVREAGQIIERFGTISLTDRDRETFLDALDAPAKANARLKKAFKAHDKAISE